MVVPLYHNMFVCILTFVCFDSCHISCVHINLCTHVYTHVQGGGGGSFFSNSNRVLYTYKLLVPG